MNRTERDFLERSLDDLENEREAGDLSDKDYAALKADYERRLQGDVPPPRPPARRGLVAVSVAFVVVVAIAAGVLVAQSVGRREDGDNITGAPAATTPPQVPAASLPEELARCTTLLGGEAIDCFTTYRDAHPDDPDGYTQFGLFAIDNGIQSGNQELLDAGESFLRRALEIEADDVEARVYLAVVLDRTGRADEAAAECARIAELDVPAAFQPLVDLACTNEESSP